MTRPAIAALLALGLAACGPSRDEAEADAHRRVLDCAYGAVAAHPEQSLVNVFDEIGTWNDASLYAAIAELVRAGRLVVTERGVRAVQPERGP